MCPRFLTICLFNYEGVLVKGGIPFRNGKGLKLISPSINKKGKK
nr:MAG TPA: Protein of unknown function (DUF1445) [Caudoviricetes sp.]